VHRDVKPSNMLMDVRPGRPDHVYLSDFGLSKAALSSTGLTGTGTFLGTVDYISPEQIQGKPVDGRADQYALACSAFELLTGQPPFRRDEAAAVVYAQLSEPPPAVTARCPGLPPDTDRVVAKAMAKAPGDRYATCWEFADALRTALGLPPYAPGPGEVQVPAHPPTEVVGTPTEDTPVSPPLSPSSRSPAGAGSPAGTGGPPGPDGGGSGSRAGLLWQRRRAPAVLAGIAVLAVVAVVAGILLAGSPARQPAVHRPSGIQIAAKSRLALVSGYVFVGYRGGKDATAQVLGQVKDAARGEVAGLYAQPFPYTSPPARVGSVLLNPRKSAPYAFTVTPARATRYTVRVFPDSTAKTSVAHSPAVTVYVSTWVESNNSRTCQRPVCHESLHLTVLVPKAALDTEMAKQRYPYFALALAPVKEPASPKWLLLDKGAGRVIDTHRISATEFGLTITFSFRIGNHAYSWNWNACSQDTEAENGMGLPGHHGCGSSRFLASAEYAG
jgi:Protein kinase domain